MTHKDTRDKTATCAKNLTVDCQQKKKYFYKKVYENESKNDRFSE